MKNRSIIAAIALSTTALSSVAPIAYAQSFDDEVIVTATRRAESIQDIPIAVTAIQPAELEKQGIVNIQNLAVVAPSFSSSNAQTSSGTVVLRIRGVGTTSNNIGFESAVGVFVDGAYQSRPGVALGEFVDVERVEVLRGPQGTLFGRNTSAGALNITNVRPNLSENGGFLNATYGNYDHTSLQGAVNLVLAEDKVAARLTGALRNRDGFVSIFDRNGSLIGHSNELDQFVLRGQVGWEMDNGFKGRVIADVSESTGACCSAIEIMRASIETNGNFAAVGLGQRGGMSNPIVALDPSDTGTAQDAASSLRASSDIVPNPTMEQAGITAELEYPITDNMDAIYIGSYRTYEAAENYDSDFTGLDIFNVVNGNPGGTNIDTMTHELRVQGDAMDGALSWLVGGYYSDESIEQNVNFELGDDYGEHIGALFGGGFGPNPLTIFSGGIDPSVVSATNAYTQDSESWSLFTHNTFDVTDALSLTVGLRYSDESKTGGFNQPSVNNPLCLGIINGITSGSTAGILAGAGLPAAAIPGTINSIFGTGCFAFTAPADLPQSALGGLPLPRTFNEKFEDNELIYTAKLGYDITPDISSYASFTHGYKSGGFNLDSTAAIQGADPSFASEEVDAYEVGMKGKFLDNRVTLNVAAFMQEFTDFQVLEFTGAQFTTFNVPKAETKGVEIETLVRATDALTLNGGLTMLKAEYPEDCAGTDTRINVTSLCGNTLTNAPKTVGIAGATYVANLGDSYKLTLNGQARYESDRRTSTQAVVLATQALNPFDIQESNVKINARAAIGDQDDIWSFEAWATNLTNEVTRAVTFNTVLRGTSRSAFVQEPAMYGVTARRKF